MDGTSKPRRKKSLALSPLSVYREVRRRPNGDAAAQPVRCFIEDIYSQSDLDH